MTKTTHCDHCNMDITTKAFATHCKSKKHLANSKGDSSIPEPTPEVQNNVVKRPPKVEVEDEDGDFYVSDGEGEEPDDDYLNDFTNDSFKPTPIEDTPKKPVPIVSGRDKLQNLIQKKQAQHGGFRLPMREPKPSVDTISIKSDDIFSRNHTPILGKSYRENLARIRQYKQLFKNELKGFKVKPKATAKELENYLVEMEAILETDTVQSYTNDMIYHVLGVVEGVTTNFKNYNLTGLTDLLRGNIQFNQLCKVLCAKYNVIGSTPPEALFVLTLASSVYIVVSQNRITAKLNEPVAVSPTKA